MDSGELKTRCLGLPGASEEFPFGDEVSVFKVGGKMFALCSLDAGPPLRLSVKRDPELAAQLRSAYPAIRPGVSPEQAALEHPHPGRLAAGRAGDRPARRLLRPGGRVAAEGAQALTGHLGFACDDRRALAGRHADETEAAVRSAFDAFLTGVFDRARKQDWPPDGPDGPDKPVLLVFDDRVSPEAAERIRARLEEVTQEIARPRRVIYRSESRSASTGRRRDPGLPDTRTRRVVRLRRSG